MYDSSDDTTSEEVSSNTDDTSDSSSTSSDSDEAPKAKRQRKSVKKFVGLESNYTCCLKVNFKWLVNECESGKSLISRKVGEKIQSPIFSVGFDDEYKWRLEFYPKGNDSVHYPVFYLCLISSAEPKVDVHYDCFIVNNKNSNQVGQEYLKQGDRFAFKKFKGVDIFFSRSVTISCELIISLSKPSVHKLKVVNDLKALFDSGSFSDVTLETENKKFKVHKFVLAARSVVFDAMFKSDMKEKKNNVVHISDISHDVMQELLRFIYTGEVENLNSIAKELLAAAEKYAFDDLKTMCENSLYESMSIDNVVDILNFSELYNASKLRKLALQYIVNNISDVIETPAFKDMGDKQSPLLAQMICLLANKK